MGHTPIPPYRAPASPTRIEQAKCDYVEGRIAVEAFEDRVEAMLEDGTGDDAAEDEGIDRIDVEKTWQ